MKRLKYILSNRYLFKIMALVVLLSSIIYTKLPEKKSIYNQEEHEFEGTVYKKKIHLLI